MKDFKFLSRYQSKSLKKWWKDSSSTLFIFVIFTLAGAIDLKSFRVGLMFGLDMLAWMAATSLTLGLVISLFWKVGLTYVWYLEALGCLVYFIWLIASGKIFLVYAIVIPAFFLSGGIVAMLGLKGLLRKKPNP